MGVGNHFSGLNPLMRLLVPVDYFSGARRKQHFNLLVYHICYSTTTISNLTAMPSTSTETGAAAAGSASGIARAMVAQPLLYLFSMIRNMVTATFWALYNDPTSWKTTLAPPVITLVAVYVAIRMVCSTLRSSLGVAWWMIKYTALLAAAIAVVAVLTGHADRAVGSGQPASRGWGPSDSLKGPAAGLRGSTSYARGTSGRL